jgi:capsid assembly protease
MKTYERIFRAVYSGPWAIQEEKLHQILAFLELKAAGGSVSEGELERLRASHEILAARSITRSTGGIRVLPLMGMITHRANMLTDISGGTSTEQFAQSFRDAVSDPAIKAIVIDVDSPGGQIDGVPELADEIAAARSTKKIIAVANTQMASAAYWLASQAGEVVATPSAMVGSIGVLWPHTEISEAQKKAGINTTLVTAGKYKAEANPLEPLSSEARAHMQSMVDSAHDQFIKAVSRGRRTSQAAVREGFGEGRVVDAQMSVKLGMADRVATLDQVLEGLGVSGSSGARAEAEALPIAAAAAAQGATVSAASPITVSVVESKPAAVAPRILSEVHMNPKEAAEILRLCKTHGCDSEFAASLIEKEGMTADAASREILAEVAKRDGKQVRTPAAENSGKMLELTAREQSRYLLTRGVMAKVSEAESGKRVNCFELEVSEEIEKKWEGKRHGNSLFVPYRLGIDPERARAAAELMRSSGMMAAGTSLAVGTATQGAELVFTEPGPFIAFLYNAMKLKELGAETMSGLQGNLAFPKQTGRATGSWVAENPGSDVADSNLTLSQVLMSPKTYQTSASYSRQLLAQAVVDIDNLVRADLARDAALAIDLAGINGTGSSNDPKGILHTTGVQNYVLEGDSGNGAKPNWDDITFMEELLEEVNADQIGEFRFLTTPGIKGLFKRTPRLVYTPAGSGTTVNVTGDPIWADDNEIDGLVAAWSNQVPNTLTKGTAVGTVHALILGVFSSMINGLWGSGFELVVDPYRLKKQGLIELTTFILTDWAMRYPAGFVKAIDCLKS